MIGQYLLSIQEPDNKTEWFILNTNHSSYEFRLGGLGITEIKSQGRKVDIQFDKAKIIKAMTDNFTVFIELDNGYCVVHSDTFIDSNGQISFEVYIHDTNFYINDGGIEGMYPIESF